MSITLAKAISVLKSGMALEWEASSSFKSGKVVLDTPNKRRLFDHLLTIDSKLVATTDEHLFKGIMDVWEDKQKDPADYITEKSPDSNIGPWRLVKIESSGFGGLNSPDGSKFEFFVDGENWCIEGYNGSGKTSLSSLILWTLTGFSIREQIGLHEDGGHREPVVDSNGKKIGTWPPLVTYPASPAGLRKHAIVESQLTFVDPEGKKAIAQRKVSSPVAGDPDLVVDIDPNLTASLELIETGLLMPARIEYIGFGEKSFDLYNAIKMLTGLDKLADLATGASNLTHKSKRFLKYGQDHRIDSIKNDFNEYVQNIRVCNESTPVLLNESYELGAENLIDSLVTIEIQASTQAKESLAILDTEVFKSLELENAEDRSRLSNAVAEARIQVDEGHKGIPLFAVLAVLSRVQKEVLSKIEPLIKESEISLGKALVWHSKRERDKRLRLKALASKFFVTNEDLTIVATCPLCETKLTSEEQKVLAKELAELKQNSDLAEREISDACGDIRKRLDKHIPEDLQSVFSNLRIMSPREDFARAIEERFAKESPYIDVLKGVATLTEITARGARESLPEFSYISQIDTVSNIAGVKELRQYQSDLRRLVALGAWWSENRSDFLCVWDRLIGKRDEQGNCPDASLRGKIKKLESAIESSKPLDEIAKLAKKAKEKAESWQKISDVQKTREDIAEAIKPLKDLQNLVDCETDRTIASLSGRVTNLLSDIHVIDRFEFKDATLSKKSVCIEGGFQKGMKIDALLVANKSWLRALLWAFVFALREQVISERGHNQFPLMVLDDPQSTFDPKNLQNWTSKIVEIANKNSKNPEGMQLFLTTHDRQFFDLICNTNSLNSQHGEIIGPTNTENAACIDSGNALKRQFNLAAKAKSDKEGFRYIQEVRIHCESLLKIMLRGEDSNVQNESLGLLSARLSSLRSNKVAPFNRTIFKKLINTMDKDSCVQNKKIWKWINDSHHNFDRTIGFAQAFVLTQIHIAGK